MNQLTNQWGRRQDMFHVLQISARKHQIASFIVNHGILNAPTLISLCCLCLCIVVILWLNSNSLLSFYCQILCEILICFGSCLKQRIRSFNGIWLGCWMIDFLVLFSLILECMLDLIHCILIQWTIPQF